MWLSVLKKIGQTLDEKHDAAYISVFDLSLDGQEDQSGEVFRLSFEPWGLSAQVIRSSGQEFSHFQHNSAWGTKDFPLSNAAFLEHLVEALEKASTPSCLYRLYTQEDGRPNVIIVRELIIEPEVAPAVEIKAVMQFICNDGQNHVFGDPGLSYTVSAIGSARKLHFMVCSKCGGPVLVNPTG